MQKIRFLPLLCVVLMLFTAPTLLAQQEPDTPYPAETMLSVRMMPPGERSLRNFLYPKLMAQEGSIQLPAGTSYNLLVQTLDNMRNDYPELFHIESYRVHYQRNQPDVAQSISPNYLCSAEEASALRKQLLETAQSWVNENPDPLALYERLVLNATYSRQHVAAHSRGRFAVWRSHLRRICAGDFTALSTCGHSMRNHHRRSVRHKRRNRFACMECDQFRLS